MMIPTYPGWARPVCGGHHRAPCGPRRRRCFALVSILLASAGPAGGQDSIPAAPSYSQTAAAVTRFIVHEMADKAIPGLSIALVEDQRIVWARGFGTARPADSLPATAQTIYRVGSVSKLFTALGVMQEVGTGGLGLDRPVTDYLPGFNPGNPGSRPVTLRQLLAHRSGLVHEPPVGNYFTPAPATLAATVASLNGTTLVFPPESTVKYSNAGYAVAGRVLEVAAGAPFDRVMAQRLLGPIGMSRSAFGPPVLPGEAAAGTMWTVDGRRFGAPDFEWGIEPAAGLRSTAVDLARFLSFLFRRGTVADTPLVDSAALEQMWRPQFEAGSFFGLGFGVSPFEGSPHVSHGGAVYGFSTELHGLTAEKLGVVVIANLEFSNQVLERLGAFALRAMRAERAGGPLPEPLQTEPIPPGRARAMRGHYFHGQRRFELLERPDGLALVPAGGVAVALRASGPDLVVDDVREFGNAFSPLTDSSIAFGEQFFTRAPPPFPPEVPARWAGLIGEYGWDHNVLYLYEDLGRLRVLIEWFFAFPLEELSDSVFRLPPRGLYAGERLVVRRDAEGRGISVSLNGIEFPRRSVGPEANGQLQVTPVRPVPMLLQEALAATPPVQPGGLRAPDLVDLATLDATIRFDIRYATTNNFLGTTFYSAARALLQRPAGEALLRAHRWLRDQGYGLLIHDAYRPWYVTRVFWDATPDSLRWLVADPANGSRHNRGAAVDLTLYDLETGAPVEMVGTYDEATPRSLPGYPGGTARQRWHRELLRTAMEAQGFTVYAEEWWHFDFDGWREYPVLNLRFEQVAD